MNILQRFPALIALAAAPPILGLSRRQLYRAAASGHLQMVKIGRSTAIVGESASAYIASLPRFVPGTSAIRRRGGAA